jgi:hypothetical protein
MAIYSGFSHWKWWFSIVMLVYQIVILIYHLPLSSVAHRLHPPNLRNPHQLQINYISENHQNPRPNSHKCLKISINPTVWCFPPPFWPWTQPVVLRITSRAVLCASSLLGGRQVDASRSRAQPVEFKVALQYVAPPTEEPMELGVEFLWCFFQLKLENLSTSFWWDLNPWKSKSQSDGPSNYPMAIYSSWAITRLTGNVTENHW